jgi:hypothetical protein
MAMYRVQAETAIPLNDNIHMAYSVIGCRSGSLKSETDGAGSGVKGKMVWEYLLEDEGENCSFHYCSQIAVNSIATSMTPHAAMRIEDHP